MSWTWPLPGLPVTVPKHGQPGAFGTIRKHDIHTGVDLYCGVDHPVVAVEDGLVMNIEMFTGPQAGSPWWNPTEAVWVLSNSGMVVYGEIEPSVKIGQRVLAGSLMGNVRTVLRTDKGVPTTMLHLELYSHLVSETATWALRSSRPQALMDPTLHLLTSMPLS